MQWSLRFVWKFMICKIVLAYEVLFIIMLTLGIYDGI